MGKCKLFWHRIPSFRKMHRTRRLLREKGAGVAQAIIATLVELVAVCVERQSATFGLDDIRQVSYQDDRRTHIKHLGILVEYGYAKASRHGIYTLTLFSEVGYATDAATDATSVAVDDSPQRLIPESTASLTKADLTHTDIGDRYATDLDHFNVSRNDLVADKPADDMSREQIRAEFYAHHGTEPPPARQEPPDECEADQPPDEPLPRAPQSSKRPVAKPPKGPFTRDFVAQHSHRVPGLTFGDWAINSANLHGIRPEDFVACVDAFSKPKKRQQANDLNKAFWGALVNKRNNVTWQMHHQAMLQ